ncbi:MAG: hypothetical protein AB7S83_01910 [Candidatus Methanomethylophilaceae archaeon]
MRHIAFDSKDFKRLKKSEDGVERGFYSPLGVGVTVEDYDTFTEAYLGATKEVCEDFHVESPMCLYSSSMLKDELGTNRAIPFAQKLIDKTSRYISKIHFSYVILPPKKKSTIKVGGERTGTYEVKTEEFLRNLSPMFSYISAWNYWRYRRDEEVKITVDAFSSKETYAWRDISKLSDLVVVSHGDEVHPLVSYADIVAFMTDVKLYVSKKRLTKQSLEEVWEDVFSSEANYIDASSLRSIRWLNENQVDYSPYLQKPTLFFISDDSATDGINSGFIDKSKITSKKSERLMGMQPVKNAIKLAALKCYSFRFYDPHLDAKYVCDGDIVVYMGHVSKGIAEYLEDGYDIETFKAKDVRNKLRSLQDN